MRILLLTFAGCPNAEAARSQLRYSLSAMGVSEEFEEIDILAPDTPDELRGWGSPTILIDGVDVAGQSAATGASCRVYRSHDGQAVGAPPESLICAALQENG